MHTSQLVEFSHLHFPWYRETGTLQNQAPEVKIRTPADGSEQQLGTAVRYEIMVLDKEDGFSDYGEIPANMVLLEATFWDNLEQARRYQQKLSETNNDPPGLYTIKSSGCFNCHRDKTRLVGPSWNDLSERYSSNPSILEKLTNQVISGSVGVWGDEPMPPHPGYSQQEIQAAVAYILEQGANEQSRIYPGFEGSIALSDHGSTVEAVVLAASYTDMGIESLISSRRRGQHSILLRTVP